MALSKCSSVSGLVLRCRTCADAVSLMQSTSVRLCCGLSCWLPCVSIGCVPTCSIGRRPAERGREGLFALRYGRFVTVSLAELGVGQSFHWRKSCRISLDSNRHNVRQCTGFTVKLSVTHLGCSSIMPWEEGSRRHMKALRVQMLSLHLLACVTPP